MSWSSSAQPMTSGPSATLTARQMLDVLRAAHRAPSIHNSQPWLFRALPDGIEVLEDADRALPASDPRGRDRLVSCGAAVRNAEVALARLGRRPRTTLFPRGAEDAVVARVDAGPAAPASAETEDLYRAIWERRTHRRIFMGGELTALPPSVEAAGRAAGVRLAVVPAHLRSRFAQLLWESAQQQVADDERREEVLEWTRGQPTPDGVPTRSHGNAPFPVDSLLVHSLRPEAYAPAWVLESLASGPVVVLLTTGNERPDWVGAGIALESVLLAATDAGLVASFLNQVVQHEASRRALAGLLNEAGHPQVVLRIGRPLVTVPPTPRRPLTEVTLDWPESSAPELFAQGDGDA